MIADTTKKVSVFGVILVVIFSHLDWISLLSINAGKYGLEKLQIRALFMQCQLPSKMQIDIPYQQK